MLDEVRKGDDATLSWLKIVTGNQTTPQIFIHGKCIGGFEELRALDQSGQLSSISLRTLSGDTAWAPRSSVGGNRHSVG